MKVSVKAGGNSYAGSSTESDSLLINMKNYPKYTKTHLIECNTVVVSDITFNPENHFSGQSISLWDPLNPDVDSQACAVALSRSKPAILRFGGGELFQDLYHAVTGHLDNNTGLPKYRFIGDGVTATVSPNGWAFGGGLSGIMRQHGFGADQVVQLEMVLPTGWHVRFGPINWKRDDELDFPRTTSVKGWCNSNPFAADEDEWEWDDCPDDMDINFDDLWHAVRGGGGGAWGVVLSTVVQLNEYPGVMKVITTGLDESAPEIVSMSDEEKKLLQKAWIDYLSDFFFFSVENINNVTSEDSEMCGAGGLVEFNAFSSGSIFCYGRGSFKLVNALWKEKISEYFSNVDDANRDQIQYVKKYMLKSTPYGYYEDYVKSTFDGVNSDNLLHLSTVPDGSLPDVPPPETGADDDLDHSLLIPKSLFAVDGPMRSWIHNRVINGRNFNGYILAGKSTTSHDGTSAIPQTQRDAGLTNKFRYNLARPLLAFMNRQLQQQEQQSLYPGGQQYNHISSREMGPLKSDWSERCPKDASDDERGEICLSIQQGVWGDEGVARLEGIKAVVDPQNLFQCYGCIGSSSYGDAVGSPPTTSAPVMNDKVDGSDDQEMSVSQTEDEDIENSAVGYRGVINVMSTVMLLSMTFVYLFM